MGDYRPPYSKLSYTGAGKGCNSWQIEMRAEKKGVRRWECL